MITPARMKVTGATDTNTPGYTRTQKRAHGTTTSSYGEHPVDTDHWGTTEEWDKAIAALPPSRLTVEDIRHQVHVHRAQNGQ